MSDITPFFWFEKDAEKAANFYVSLWKSVFGKAGLGSVMRYDKDSAAASGQPEGSALTVSFNLNGTDFTALNGGKPEGFDTKFTGAVSFVVSCKTQSEIDKLWEGLGSDGGRPGQCGWITDKFGVTWQIVPADLDRYLGGKDKEGAGRAMRAMLQMTKLDMTVLKAAYEGR